MSGAVSLGVRPGAAVGLPCLCRSCGWLLKNMVRNRCGASTCVSAGRLGDVELGHEFAVGGAGGGEVLVAFFELQP